MENKNLNNKTEKDILSFSYVQDAGDIQDALEVRKREIEERLKNSFERIKKIERRKKEILRKIEEEVKKEQAEKEEKEREKLKRINVIILEGKSFFRQKQYEKAIEVWAKGLIIDPENGFIKKLIEEAESMIRFEIEEAERKKELEEELEKERREKLNLGRAYYREGQYEKAIEVWEEILRKEGEKPEILKLIDKAENRIREINEEIVRAKKEKEEREKQIRQLLFEGRRYFRRGEYEKAIEIWESIYAIDPENKIVVEEIRRAEKQILLKKQEEERKKAEKKEIFLTIQLEALRKEREEKYEEAVSLWEKLAVDEQYSEYAVNEIKKLEKKIKEKKQKVREELKKKEEEKIHNEEKEKLRRDVIESENKALYNKGRIYFRKGMYEKAVQLWEKIIENDPNRRDIAELIEIALEKSKKAVKKSKILNFKLKQREKYVQKNILNAKLAVVNNDFENALSFAEKALYAATDKEKIYELIEEIKSRQKNYLEKFNRVEFLILKSIELETQGDIDGSLNAAEEAVKILPGNKKVKERIRYLTELIAKKREERLLNEKKLAEIEISVFEYMSLKDFESARKKAMEVLNLKELEEEKIRTFFNNLIRKIEEEAEKYKNEVVIRELKKKELFSKAVSNYEKGNYSEAIEFIDKVLVLDSNDGESKMLKSKILSLIEDKKEKTEKESEKNEEMIKEVKLAEVRSLKLLEDNKYDEAINIFTELMEKYPENNNIEENIKAILAKKSEYLRRLEEEKKLKEEEERKKLLEEKEKEESKKRKEKDLLLKGVTLFESEDFKTAIRVFEEILLENPANEKALHYLNLAREKVEKEIRSNLEKEIYEKNKEREARRYYYEGRRAYREGNYELALEYFEKSAEIAGINQKLAEEIHRTELKIKEEKTQLLKEEDLQRERIDKINNLDLEAKRYFREGNYSKAILNWEEILLIMPEHPSARQNIEEAEKKLSEQKRQKEEQERKAKENAKEMILAGVKALGENKFGDAFVFFQNALIFDPQNLQAKEQLEKAIRLKEEYDKMEYEKVKKEVEEKRKLQETELNLKREIASKIENYTELALKYFEEKNYIKAISEWKKIKAISPESAWVDEEIRRIELKLKEDYIKSVQERELEVKRKEKINELWMKGRKHMRDEEYKEAIECFESILVLDRTNPEIRSEIRIAEQKLREKQAKLEMEIREKELQMKKLTELVYKGNKYFYAQQYDKAIECWEEALLLEPDNFQIREAIYRAEEKLNELKRNKLKLRKEKIRKLKLKKVVQSKAERDLKKKKFISLLVKKGDVAFENQNYEKALLLYEKAFRYDRFNMDLQRKIRNTELMILEKKRVEKELLKKEEEIRKKIKYYVKLAEEKFDIGDYESAIENWKEALKLDPQRDDILGKIKETEKAMKELRESEDRKKKEVYEKELELIRIQEEKEKERQQKIEKIFEQGRNYFERGDYLKAAGVWKEILLIDEDNEFIKEEIAKAEYLAEEKKKREEKEKEQALKRKEEEEKRRKEEEKIKFEKLISSLKAEAAEMIKIGKYKEAMEKYEEIIKLSPDDKDARVSLVELQKFFIELEKEKITAKEEIAKDVEELKKQFEENDKDFIKIKEEISAIKKELRNVYLSSKKFLKVYDYERVLQDIKKALKLAEKYSIKNFTVYLLKRLYKKTYADYEKSLEMKARILAASSDVSFEDAMEKYREKLKSLEEDKNV